mmetsp:Transcript_2325/g.3501  ORF Transcript_2325/g.3501 Transcript_2325/m.3501 type:complete len:97 (-) Transcript_2325:1000-1290(-)
MLRNRIATARLLPQTRAFALQVEAKPSDKKVEEISQHYGRTDLEKQLLGFSIEEIAKMPKGLTRASQKLEYKEKAHRKMVSFNHELSLLEKHSQEF